MTVVEIAFHLDFSSDEVSDGGESPMSMPCFVSLGVIVHHVRQVEPAAAVLL